MLVLCSFQHLQHFSLPNRSILDVLVSADVPHVLWFALNQVQRLAKQETHSSSLPPPSLPTMSVFNLVLLYQHFISESLIILLIRLILVSLVLSTASIKIYDIIS